MIQILIAYCNSKIVDIHVVIKHTVGIHKGLECYSNSIKPENTSRPWVLLTHFAGALNNVPQHIELYVIFACVHVYVPLTILNGCFDKIT